MISFYTSAITDLPKVIQNESKGDPDSIGITDLGPEQTTKRELKEKTGLTRPQDLETCEPAVRQLSSMLLGATSRKRKRNKAPKKHQRAVHMLRLARCDFASHTTRLFHASALLSRSNSNSKLQRKRP